MQKNRVILYLSCVPWLGGNINQGPKMNNALPRLTIFKDCGGTDHLILVISKTLFPLQQNWPKNS